MAEASITTDDIATLRAILDRARTHPGQSAVDAMLDVLSLLQRLVGCDILPLRVTGSSVLPRWHERGLTDEVRRLVRPENAASPRPDPDVVMAASFWWATMCSIVERAGAPVIISVRAHAGLPEDHGVSESMPVTSGPPVGERELVLLRLLHPHLKPLFTAAVEHPAGSSEAGSSELTPRQLEILRLVKLGMPNKRIARVLQISEGTVRKHLEHAYERLGVQSRVAAVSAALDHDDGDGDGQHSHRTV